MNTSSTRTPDPSICYLKLFCLSAIQSLVLHVKWCDVLLGSLLANILQFDIERTSSKQVDLVGINSVEEK